MSGVRLSDDYVYKVSVNDRDQMYTDRMDGMKLKEIANKFKVSVPTVRHHILRRSLRVANNSDFRSPLEFWL